MLLVYCLLSLCGRLISPPCVIRASPGFPGLLCGANHKSTLGKKGRAHQFTPAGSGAITHSGSFCPALLGRTRCCGHFDPRAKGAKGCANASPCLSGTFEEVI